MILRLLFKVVLVAAIAGALYLLYTTLKQYSFDEVADAVRAIPAGNLAMGLGFAACSYFCLACSDAMAVRYAGKPLPFHQTALASFTALSIGHNVGVAALSSGAVRYRFYSRWGLTVEDVAKVIVFCGMTVALGIATLGAIGFYLRPDDAARMTKLSPETISWIGAACLLFPIVYSLLAAFVRAPLRFRNWSFKIPKLHLAIGQVIVGTVNFAFVAASLHQMLTAFAEAGYLKVAAASITANIAAIISHVPGGLGVLEATIVHILPGAESIAAVIAFRVVYYFIPLAIGLPLLIASEIYYRAESEPELRENIQET
ncbi:MAG: hypothetical protein JWM58_2797 [Rhizobium sp.]|nr:hypothetical protein [Rhizobium sp.]